ncbi:MAG TPA: FixH family protein [Pirellulaceae bacterium]|jgi:uncharacterized membrane protein|nr:FixH family protein [Pirellulaceae bacterium]
MDASPYSLEITHPWRLLCLAALPILIYFFYRSLVDFPRWQRGVSLAVRSLIVVLLVLALAGLTLLHPTREQFVLFLVDESRSVDEEAKAKANAYLDAAVASAGDEKFAFLPFSLEPGELTTERKTAAERDDDASQKDATDSPPSSAPDASKEEPGGTNLEAAVETALASLPPGYVGEIVLLSDGNQTRGEAVRAALKSDVPISAVPLPTRSEAEVQVASVEAPAEVAEGEPFYVEVVVDSNHDDEGTIVVYRGPHEAVREKREIKKGENRFRFQQSVTGDRLAQFSARVEGFSGDGLLDDNSADALVYASGKPRVLIVERDPDLIRELAFALEQEGIAADVRPPSGMPETLSDLQNYEMLILSDVPATDLTQRQMEVARTYVQDLGGGFMMLGGDQSFGLGGYYKSTLEEILPVRSDFEKEKEKPSIGMVIVVDKSGSMMGDKIEMAKTAARNAVELLGPSDMVGVVAFDGETYVICDLQSASQKGRISDEISRIDASGGTTMYPAMEQAYDMLVNAPARLKHVIMLTDGVSSPGDFEGMAATMRSSKITVSTVAMGTDSDTQLLEEIARVGQGRHYVTDDPSAIPQIFAKETVTASKSAIEEQPFLPQTIRATQTLAGLDMEAAPFLLGYVTTRPKPTCEVILATEKGDPLLAWWRYGLGMTVAFTSDAKARWASEWLGWPGYGKFWAQVIRHAMRKSDARGVEVTVERRGDVATVTLDAADADGRFVDAAQTDLTLIDPRLGTKKVSLSQTAPGRYTAEISTPLPGAYHLELAQKQEGQLLFRQSRGLTVGYSDELRLRPTNESLLRSLAVASRGTYDPPAASIFVPDGRTARRPEPLWPWLLAAAAILLVGDVFLRRIDIAVAMGRSRPVPAWGRAATPRAIRSRPAPRVSPNREDVPVREEEAVS